MDVLRHWTFQGTLLLMNSDIQTEGGRLVTKVGKHPYPVVTKVPYLLRLGIDLYSANSFASP